MSRVSRSLQLQMRKFFLSVKLDVIEILFKTGPIYAEITKCYYDELSCLYKLIKDRWSVDLNLIVPAFDRTASANCQSHVITFRNIWNILQYDLLPNDLTKDVNYIIDLNKVMYFSPKINEYSLHDAPPMNNYYTMKRNRDFSAHLAGRIVFSGTYDKINSNIIIAMRSDHEKKIMESKDIKKFEEDFKNRILHRRLSHFIPVSKTSKKSLKDFQKEFSIDFVRHKPVFGIVSPSKINPKSHIVDAGAHYHSNYWNKFMALYSVKFNTVKILIIENYKSIDWIKYTVQKFNINAIFTKMKLPFLVLKDIKKEFYIYKLYEIKDIHKMIEVTSKRNYVTGFAARRLDDDASFLVKIIDYTPIRNQNWNLLFKYTSKIDFTAWNKIDWTKSYTTYYSK